MRKRGEGIGTGSQQVLIDVRTRSRTFGEIESLRRISPVHDDMIWEPHGLDKSQISSNLRSHQRELFTVWSLQLVTFWRWNLNVLFSLKESSFSPLLHSNWISHKSPPISSLDSANTLKSELEQIFPSNDDQFSSTLLTSLYTIAIYILCIFFFGQQKCCRQLEWGDYFPAKR